MKINKENFETFFLLYVDNELDASERKEVEAFVKNNPQLQKSFDDLCATVLHPESVSMPQKSLLMHQTRSSKYVVFAKYAAAAILVGLVIRLGISLFSTEGVVDQQATSEAITPKENQSNQSSQPPTILTQKDSNMSATNTQESDKAFSKVKAIAKSEKSAHKSSKTLKEVDELRETTSHEVNKISNELAANENSQSATAIPHDTTTVSQSIEGMESLLDHNDTEQLASIEKPLSHIRNVHIEIIHEGAAKEEANASDQVIMGMPAEKFKKGKLGKFIDKTAKILDQGNPINKLLSKN